MEANGSQWHKTRRKDLREEKSKGKDYTYTFDTEAANLRNYTVSHPTRLQSFLTRSGLKITSEHHTSVYNSAAKCHKVAGAAW